MNKRNNNKLNKHIKKMINNKANANHTTPKPIQLPNIPQYHISNCLQIESSQLSLTSQSNPFQLSVSPFKEDLSKLSNPAFDISSKSISNNSMRSLQISNSHSKFIENILSDSQANHIDSIQSNDLIISSNSIVFKQKSPINSSLTICNYFDHSNDVTPKIVKSHSDSNNLSLVSDNINILSSKKNFLFEKKTPIKYTKSQLKKTDRTISKKNIKESTENDEIHNMNDTSLMKGKKNLKDTFEKMIKEEHSRQITEIYTKGINDLFMGTNDYNGNNNQNVQQQSSAIDTTKKKECSTTKTKSTRNNSSSSSIHKHINTQKKPFFVTNKNCSKMTLKINSLSNANNYLNSRTIDTPNNGLGANLPKKNFYHLKNVAMTKTMRAISQNNTKTRNKSLQSKDAINNKNDKGVTSKEKVKIGLLTKKVVVLKTKLVKKDIKIPLTKIYNNDAKMTLKDKTQPYKTERNNNKTLDKKPIHFSNPNRSNSNSFKTKRKISNNIVHNQHQQVNYTNHHYQFKPKTKDYSKQKEANKAENISQLLVKLYNLEKNKTPQSIKDQTVIPKTNINLLKTPEGNPKLQHKTQFNTNIAITNNDKRASLSPKVIQNFSRYHILKQKREELAMNSKCSCINLDNSIELMNNYTYEKPPVLFTKINQVFGDSDSEIAMETE